ncbi:hypothetical protein ANRL4_01197 [Anaerolineae bacterium]|nr:hypothetical protein ANRL4_01197 [Anaerolineae bacterium]
MLDPAKYSDEHFKQYVDELLGELQFPYTQQVEPRAPRIFRKALHNGFIEGVNQMKAEIEVLITRYKGPDLAEGLRYALRQIDIPTRND